MSRCLIAYAVVIAAAGPASADEPVDGGEVRERAHERISLGFDAGVRQSAAGTSQLGAGIVGRYSDGPYTLSLGLTRWSPVERDAQEHSWQLAVRGYRHFQLAGALRGHLLAGVNAERVTTGGGSGSAVGAELGGGLSMRINKLVTVWADLTLGQQYWIAKPPDRSSATETTLMLSLGLAFD
jgi:hypothetical protein